MVSHERMALGLPGTLDPTDAPRIGEAPTGTRRARHIEDDVRMIITTTAHDRVNARLGG